MGMILLTKKSIKNSEAHGDGRSEMVRASGVRRSNVGRNGEV